MRLGFARVDARFDLVIGHTKLALEKQNTVIATALESQTTAIEKQNTAIEKQNAVLGTAIEKQNTAIASQNTTLERALKEQTRFYFLAWAVQLAAIIGLYAR